MKMLMQLFILKMIHFKYFIRIGVYNNKTLDMKFEKNVKAFTKKVTYLLKKLSI